MNNYRLNRPPTPLLKAKLDNISIVPASLLPIKGKFEAFTNKMPEGSVLLCHSSISQKKILDNVASHFRQKGHKVTSLPSEGLV